MNKIILSDNREIEIRELKVKDVLAADKYSSNPLIQEIFLIHCATGISMADIEEFAVYDYRALKEKVFEEKK